MRALAVVFAAAFVLCVAAPVRAGEASALQVKVRAALRAAKSFVATAAINPSVTAPNGGTVVYTYVAPNRFRQTVHGLPGGDDTIVIGNKVYGNNSGDTGGWDVQTWSDHLVNSFEGDLLDFTILSVGAESTASTGTFVMADSHGEKKTDTLQCTYDIATSRPRTCITGYVTLTFARYDDPTVTIPTPEHAKVEDPR
jgi:hypothetical protein